MYLATIKIIDTVKNRENIIGYITDKCKKYSDLFTDIRDIYPEYEDGSNITLLLVVSGRKLIIREFDRYIRYGDVIELIISKSVYLLCDCSGREIKTSTNIKDLYEYYYTLTLNYEVFIVKLENKDIFLIDVLDSSAKYYNDCVNRLVTRYNF